MAGRKKVPGHVQKGGRSLMVSKSLTKLGIPRIYRSSGTMDKNVLASIKNMLNALAQDGTPESVTLLHKLARGEVPFLLAVADWRKKGTTGVKKLAEDTAPIDEASCIEWLSGKYTKASTRTGYLKNYRTMMKHAKPGETMTDLPTILGRYRVWCVKNGKNFRAFDYAVAVAQAWVRSVLTDESETYRKLRKVERFGVRPDPRKKEYFSPREIMNVVQKLPDDVGAMVWSMAVYGCGPKEYMVDGWRIEENGVHIFGEKSAHRDRIVPLLSDYPPAPAVVTYYKKLHRWLSKASNGAVTPYTMRNCYPRWLGLAGVPYAHAQMYQGHAPTRQTDTYAFHDTAKTREGDAAKLQTWIQEELKNNPPSEDVTKVKIGAPRGWQRASRTYQDDTIAPEVKGKKRKRKAA